MALNSWTPFLAGTYCWNHQAHEGFSTISLEWQDFLARRFKEDAGLLNKIATSTSPGQLWAAYASFWKKAMDDYGAAPHREVSKICSAYGAVLSGAANSPG